MEKDDFVSFLNNIVTDIEFGNIDVDDAWEIIGKMYERHS